MQHELDDTSAAVARPAAGGPAGAGQFRRHAAVPPGSSPLRHAAAAVARRRAGRLVLGAMPLAPDACGEVRLAQLATIAATGSNGGSEHKPYFDATGHAHPL